MPMTDTRSETELVQELHALLRDVAMSDGFRTAKRPREEPAVEEPVSSVAAGPMDRDRDRDRDRAGEGR